MSKSRIYIRTVIGGLLPVLVIALGVVGVGASPAHAGSWTVLHSRHGGALVACKTPVDSPYGPLWRVQVALINGSATHGHNGGVTVRRNDPYSGRTIHSVSFHEAAGQWSNIRYVYVSRVRNDYMLWGFGEWNGSGLGGDVGMRYISYC
ncbi:MAG: hypothetical protein M3423_08300 [Actinomycetota bacterium]|nr:hypothetical protein [Actinomycetota bacterium]